MGITLRLGVKQTGGAELGQRLAFVLLEVCTQAF